MSALALFNEKKNVKFTEESGNITGIHVQNLKNRMQDKLCQMQHNYVYMRRIYVNMQDNYVDMQHDLSRLLTYILNVDIIS